MVTTAPARLFEPALDPSPDPISLFRLWLSEAALTEPNDPNAMSLATSTRDGQPSVRMVLMKGLDERGFAFYTHGESQKGHELQANPRASACFHWKTQRRQIRIQGNIHVLPEADAEHYFHTRSRGSQIAAAVSHQSHPLPDRETLESAANALELRFPNEIPCPADWLGFAIRPETIEFWQDGANRMHDRMLFTQTAGGWKHTRLYP